MNLVNVETTPKNNFKVKLAKFMWRLACRLARRMLLIFLRYCMYDCAKIQTHSVDRNSIR